ncbi:MAG TPA: hypothetical protein VFJ16_23495 [Longimicrobium sp.]|nr:hypothetical protein [Longimicrobium sp.]
MDARITKIVCVLAASLAATAPNATHAQTQRMSVTEVLARFRQGALEANPNRDGAMNAIARLLGINPIYAPATVDSVLAGLERMALDESSEAVANAGAAMLARSGQLLGPRGGGVLPRMLRLYEATTNPVVRLMIIQGVALQPDSETDEGIAFLTQVAESTDTVSEDEPWYAVATLDKMGEPGRSAMQRLHRNSAVRNGKARGYLEHLVACELTQGSSASHGCRAPHQP